MAIVMISKVNAIAFRLIVLMIVSVKSSSKVYDDDDDDDEDDDDGAHDSAGITSTCSALRHAM